MKIKSIEATANEIVGMYGGHSFEMEVDRLAFRNSILVFVTDKNGGIIYTFDEHSPRNGQKGPGNFGGQRPLPWDYGDFF